MRLRTALIALAVALAAAACRRDQVSFIRVNQLGYLPEGPKIAVVCSLDEVGVEEFELQDDRGRTVFGPAIAESANPFGPCSAAHRLDFSEFKQPGVYRVVAAGTQSRPFAISPHAYAGTADTLLVYMRQQRSGFNPVFNDSVHHTTDAIVVDHPTREGEFVPVAGGWADAADYLQYVTTSAHATFSMLIAYRDHPDAFGDEYQANGLPGPNGIADVLDEARHGLEWLSRMFPGDGTVFNQLGDDRDHVYADLPVNDSSDYGWGRGGPRPVYPCTGEPQGLLEHKNRATGIASTAGKFASSFALGAMILDEVDPAFAEVLAPKAIAAYEIGVANPGVCQTAPAGAPYFYEEDSWADDMELAAIELYALTGEGRYLDDAVAYAGAEPVTPWMGADTARHYQWFPWHNYGHYEIWRLGPPEVQDVMVDHYRAGLEAVSRRADNGFRIGTPFIWCSNNLMASLATQALLYRRMSGDTTYRILESSAVDWLFGVNPWGVSMVIGMPADGVFPLDPHSVVTRKLGLQLTGGLVDGPVYRSIYENLRGITLYSEDEYAPFNTGRMVYHDDYGDYSTNEPIMDGTANLAYILAGTASGTAR
jgi:hypothetical protein